MEKEGDVKDLPATKEQYSDTVDSLSPSSFDQYLSAEGTDTDEDTLLSDNFFSTFMDAMSSGED